MIVKHYVGSLFCFDKDDLEKSVQNALKTFGYDLDTYFSRVYSFCKLVMEREDSKEIKAELRRKDLKLFISYLDVFEQIIANTRGKYTCRVINYCFDMMYKTTIFAKDFVKPKDFDPAAIKDRSEFADYEYYFNWFGYYLLEDESFLQEEIFERFDELFPNSLKSYKKKLYEKLRDNLINIIYNYYCIYIRSLYKVENRLKYEQLWTYKNNMFISLDQKTNRRHGRIYYEN
ncbi:MAG: hypothetical protein J1F35_01650 [Erysipelotrichales bacterium]|nr:hypothetical protein [Erysipelotrichales bacterium]